MTVLFDCHFYFIIIIYIFIILRFIFINKIIAIGDN